MRIEELKIEGAYLLEPQRHGDARGYFMETFKRDLFEQKIGKVEFIQENESKSHYGVVRGLHFQRGEFAQAKLVRAVVGRVLDILVDLRSYSHTFGQHVAVELSDENALQLFIPRGVAHGYAVLSDEAIFSYKVDNVYAPSHEMSLAYNDASLNIDWHIPADQMQLSAKDQNGTPMSSIYKFER